MNTKYILFATLLASAFTPALAEDLSNAQDGDNARRIVIRTATIAPGVASAGDNAMARAMVQIASADIVKNAPYSAEAVSERLQQLPDGNQIVNKSSSLQYRDSAGRTRTEVRDDDGKVRTITISDPVEGARWVLNPEFKTATRISIASQLARAEAAKAHAAAAQARVAAAQARAEAEGARISAEQQRKAAEQARLAADRARERFEQLRKEGKLPEGTVVTEGTHIIVKDVQRAGPNPTPNPQVRVRVAQPAPLALPEARALTAQIAPLIVGAANDGKWSSRAVTRELGTREFSGVKASGAQRSYEIPAGEIGNRNPIAVSSETWTSPELQVMVYFRHSDPRSGELVYRLENVRRGEPAAALFSVPPDYKVRDPLAMAGSAGVGKDD